MPYFVYLSKKTMYETIGWLGTAAFIVAYFLLSINRLKADGVAYQGMNLFGAVCLVANAAYLNDGPTFVLNFVWGAIGLFALIRILRPKNRC